MASSPAKPGQLGGALDEAFRQEGAAIPTVPGGQGENRKPAKRLAEPEFAIQEPQTDRKDHPMFREDLLAGKRILVTGGGTGLGRAMAERFVELGAEVHICGRRRSTLEETAETLRTSTGGSVTTHTCDIRDAEAVAAMIETIWQAGPLDGLVNNAAGNFVARTEDLSPRAFDAIANTVLHGTFYCTNACGRRWISEGLRGSILNILVTWVWTGSPYVVPSTMSKAGVAAMTKSLAVEWGPYGIRVNSIAPGPFPTAGASERLRPKPELVPDYGATVPMGRTGNPAELANLAAFLMADEVAYLTGQNIAIDGGQMYVGGGTFSDLASLTNRDWAEIRELARAADAKDKAERA